MAELKPKTLVEDLVFAESPRWRDGRLYFSDMLAGEVLAVDLEGCREIVAMVPAQPSGLGWLPDGRMVIVSMRDRRLVVAGRTGIETYADLSSFAAGHANDMVIDGAGRAYVGNYGFDLDAGESPKPAALAMVTPEGEVRTVADELMFANGCAITADGKTLIVAETFAARLTAFDIFDDGSLGKRRVWAQVPALPDGICLDAENCVWCASPLHGGGFLRVREGGEVLARIELTEGGGTACMLGGPERRTLFLLEAKTPIVSECRRGNARIRVTQVDVPGVGLPA
jgi:sugar lactone lactonase YvrE